MMFTLNVAIELMAESCTGKKGSKIFLIEWNRIEFEEEPNYKIALTPFFE